jgi:hypothetical protein
VGGKARERTDLARFFPYLSVLSREGPDMERIQPHEEGHSRGRDGRLVGTRKEIDCARRTHELRTAEGGRDLSGHCQDTERKQLSEGHSRIGGKRSRICKCIGNQDVRFASYVPCGSIVDLL